MPRKARRSGVKFIEDEGNRSLTFFKRRSGLFKAASDLSALTIARVVMVLECENERFSSFSTPKADPIVDAFLSGDAPPESDTTEKQKVVIINLQNELFQLEKDKVMEDKRKKENMLRTKEIQETSRMAKYVYGKVEDLDATELNEMYHELSRIEQEINDRLPWWRSMPSNVATLPKYFPYAPSQMSFQ
ncbi:transcription factor RLM1-like [Panicum miliaceum]|uniref:Transcription factor RLM1-like n=1 Tax=Panicum miliaceum TaxID=4540 RepID=A0A3L6SQK9_PANMI|nr:transcription factor RLM1-like [Panicum miliaceum]